MLYIAVLIKYFFLSFCGFFVFCKLQNMHVSKYKILIFVFCSAAIAGLYLLIKKIVPQLNILSIVIPILLFLKVIFRQPFKSVIPLGLNSISVSFVLSIICALIASGIMLFAQLIFHYPESLYTNIVHCVIVGILQMLLSYLFFKIKRFSKGIPNLDKYLESDLSLYISVSIIIFMAFSEIKETNNAIIIFIVFLIAFLGIILFFVWKMHLKKTYIGRQTEKIIEDLNKSIFDLQQQNEKNRLENESLASTIHRDNKTISSFINTLSSAMIETTDISTHNMLEHFIDYLLKENSERKLYLCKNFDQSLPKTNVFAIDSILNFMQNKASDYGISFELIIEYNINELIDKEISEIDLVTILADLIENAIIATKNSVVKKIAICFTKQNTFFSLTISDTGTPFSPIILKNFGVKKITTHKADGGSGIGLVTVCDILHKYNSSLCLIQDELKPIKSIEIVFNKLSTFTITSK